MYNSTWKYTIMADHSITLRDGRRLSYLEFGALDGEPVLFFHGTPGSRLFYHPDESILINLGIRLITVDRPGYGRSDPKPNRTYLDWPDDVEQLVTKLKLDRFAIAGHSGGGPHFRQNIGLE